MQFTSMRFVGLLGAAALGSRMMPGKTRYIWLFGVNLFFYLSWKPVYGLFLAFSILVTWSCALWMERQEKRSVLWFCILINLSVLFFLNIPGLL